jgi:endonuclease/exonuclease/phosphatase family metal-dependent hydrolase
MRLFLLNANSLNNKVWQLESEILLYHIYPDFVAITETWLTEVVSSDIFKFNAYSVYRRDRVTDSHGGVMFLVKNSLSSEQISRDSQIEILWVLVDFGTHRTVFGVYYRAHVSHVVELDLLREELAFVTAAYPNVPIVIVGDFNMPDINWADGFSPSIYKQDEYLNLFSEYNLTQVVDKPTRRDKILDLVLVSEPCSILKVDTHAPLGKSDHQVVECVIAGACIRTKERNDMGQFGYCWSRARWKELTQSLRKINWWDIFLEEDLHDANTLWRKFKNEMHRQIDSFVPKLNKNVQNKIGRLSKAALSAIREKRRTHRRLQRSRNMEETDEQRTMVEADKRAYQAAVRNVGTILAREKIHKERNLASKPSLGKFYKFINSKLKYKQNVSSVRLPDGVVTTDEQKISEVFSEYFKSVFSPAPDRYPAYRNLGQNPKMDDFTITRDEVERAISECPDKYSSGCDGIPNIFL